MNIPSEFSETFREIGPYEGAEVRNALKRVFNDPTTTALARFLFPTWSLERFKAKYDAVQSVDEFQTELIAPAVTSLINQTTSGLEIEGLDQLDRSKRHLFISNHRDIVLDPALFVFKLHQEGFDTPKVALGDNLLFSQWVTDLVKLNKSIIVKRSISGRELLRSSQALSAYIRLQITGGHDSVWIAQREGRAKDGNDFTQPALLKMLAMGSKAGFLERISELRLTPVSISYEYDPCDAVKARERLERELTGSYAKREGEDQMSILLGLQGHKGRVMIRVGREISPELSSFREIPGPELPKAVAEILDRHIVGGYKLWPSAWIACDLLEGTSRFTDRYTIEQKAFFEKRLTKQIETLEGPAENHEAIRSKALEMYANPARNAGKA